MKTRVTAAIVLFAALAATVLTGCRHPLYARAAPKQVCDWCGQGFYVAAGQGDYATQAAATRDMLPLKNKAIADKEGYVFCSLRCKSAYDATKPGQKAPHPPADPE